jgi:hypothetical protein
MARYREYRKKECLSQYVNERLKYIRFCFTQGYTNRDKEKEINAQLETDWSDSFNILFNNN